jgi:hypothetical protein
VFIELSIPAPNGGVITSACLHVRGRWPWLVATVGCVFVAATGILMNQSAHDQTTVSPATSTWIAR